MTGKLYKAVGVLSGVVLACGLVVVLLWTGVIDIEKGKRTDAEKKPSPEMVSSIDVSELEGNEEDSKENSKENGKKPKEDGKVPKEGVPVSGEDMFAVLNTVYPEEQDVEMTNIGVTSWDIGMIDDLNSTWEYWCKKANVGNPESCGVAKLYAGEMDRGEDVSTARGNLYTDGKYVGVFFDNVKFTHFLELCGSARDLGKELEGKGVKKLEKGSCTVYGFSDLFR